MNPNIPFGLGSHKSKFDIRDKIHKDKTLTMATPYPNKYTTDISTLEMRMQYFIGKCVGEGTAKKIDSLFPGSAPFSDDFLYRGAKTIDGNLNEGTDIRSALKFAQNTGVATKSTFQVPVTNSMSYSQYITYPIPQSAFTEAAKYKIGQYIPIPIDSESLKAAIFNYGIVVVRMNVGQEWWTPDWIAADILPLKSPTTVVSGHCVVLYGYDSTITPGKTLFYLSNSWSSAWANQGNGNFYLEDYKPTEAWAVTLNPVPPVFPPFDLVMRLVNILIRAGILTITKLGLGGV